jgi:EAL domain-containing protein (putative c-di-GMP-specific phosphodiesterase class I)
VAARETPLDARDPKALAALRRALEETDQLLLLYQPIHECRSGSIVAAEALLRQRRENGEIREAGIISAAAEANRTRRELFTLDSLIARRAFADASRLNSNIRLNINLSPREFQDGGVIGRMGALLEESAVDPARINVEITETRYIESPEETTRVLAGMTGLGIHLWLDDFGTGHSSIAHLQHFPLAGLKIGGSFIEPLTRDRRCRAIVRSIIAMAHDLGLEVVAEEVETREQLDLLIEYQCDFAQGFFHSKPMSVQELEARFRK